MILDVQTPTRTVTLKDLGIWRGGGTPSKSNPAFWTGGTIPWVSPKDMKSFRVSEPEDHITPEAVSRSATSLVHGPSVAVVTRSGILERTLPVAVIPMDATFNQDMKVLQPIESVLPEYVAHYLRGHEQDILSTCSKNGTTVASIDFARLQAYQIPLPSLDQQRLIVDEIETQLARLDDAVASLQRARTRLRRYRASVLKAACEGRLVPTEAELARREGRDYEPAGVLLERIRAEREISGNERRPNAIKASVLDTSDSNALPEGWAWTTWANLAGRVTVGHVGPMKNEYVPTGVPFLRSQNVRENRFEPEGLLYISEAFHRKLSKSMIVPGDLAVVRSGSVGVTCVIPETLGEANCADLVLIQRPSGIVPQFGAYYMNSLAKRLVREGQVGVALIHFNTKSVAALPVPIPPIAEQVRIVEEVERRLSNVDVLEATVEANLKRAKALRQSILRKAFSGGLVA